ncbi:MAG: hypothetical protein WCO42_05045 [bacterium]
MNRLVRFSLILLPLFLSSCRTLPPNPEAVARVKVAYEAEPSVPYEARQSMVMEFSPHWWWPTLRMTVLGYSRVNPKTGDYAVVCLSPLGVKLFDVARTNGQTTARISLPVPGGQQEAEKAIGDDISRLYFDMTPAPGATVTQKGGRLVFWWRDGKDWNEYEYDILSTRLVRKAACLDGSLSTLVFGDYRKLPCGTYPLAMKLTNSKNRYSLTIRNLDIRAARFDQYPITVNQ